MRRRPSPPGRYIPTNKPVRHGGYGIVEVWHDTSLDRDVAIKWMAASADGEEQLLNEWRPLAQAMSPFVAEIYDVVVDHDGTLAGLIIEYIDGRDLSSYPLPASEDALQQALRVLYQYAQGLADIHAAGMVHRDVKPENAVLGADGRLKIVDFGLSSETAHDTLRARQTFGYSAPELFATGSISITAASDVYSFGRTVWKVLANRLPSPGKYGFPEASSFPLPSIRTALNVSPRLADAIDASLAFSPHERISMAALATAFAEELVKDKHEGMLFLSGVPYLLNANERQKAIDGVYGKLAIRYDGYEFLVRAAEGEVFVNGAPAYVGVKLREGCLITFGDSHRGASRAFVRFRQSSPNLVI